MMFKFIKGLGGGNSSATNDGIILDTPARQDLRLALREAADAIGERIQYDSDHYTKADIKGMEAQQARYMAFDAELR